MAYLSNDGSFNQLTVNHLTVVGSSNIGQTTTLSSAGGTQSLVVEGTGPNLSIAGLEAGANITFTPSDDFVTISAASGAVTTLASAGGGGSQTLVVDGTGPDLSIID